MKTATAKDTTMEAAMKKAGGPGRRDARFIVAIAEYHNNGGTYEGALALLRAAYKLPGEGHAACAATGHSSSADARQRHEDGAGHAISASNGQEKGARPSSPDRGGGHLGHAPKGQPGLVPVREHTRAKRGMAVMAATQKPALLTVMDTMKVRDGTPWRNVRHGDLDSIRFESARDAYLARQCQRHVANAEPHMTVGDTVSVETFQRFVQRAAEMADAA